MVDGKKPHMLMRNPFALENIKTYLSTNYPYYELLDTTYNGCKHKMRFICHRHEDKGIQYNTIDNIMNNHHVCRYCGYETGGRYKEIDETIIKDRIDELGLIYVGRFKENGSSIVKFICPHHKDKGVQRITWDHLKTCSIGCPYCYGKYKTTQDFVNEMSLINRDVKILGEYKGYSNPIKCKCNICGYEWETSIASLRQGNGCIKCSSSKGEKKIEQYLEANNICFEKQKIFRDCKSISLLKYDFFVPSLNTVIEYDGEQHFKPVDFGGKGFDFAKQQFKNNKVRDEIKNKYCSDNNIILIRIPYFEYDNIDQILDEKLMTKAII